MSIPPEFELSISQEKNRAKMVIGIEIYRIIRYNGIDIIILIVAEREDEKD